MDYHRNASSKINSHDRSTLQNKGFHRRIMNFLQFFLYKFSSKTNFSQYQININQKDFDLICIAQDGWMQKHVNNNIIRCGTKCTNQFATLTICFYHIFSLIISTRSIARKVLRLCFLFLFTLLLLRKY